MKVTLQFNIRFQFDQMRANIFALCFPRKRLKIAKNLQNRYFKPSVTKTTLI